MHLDRRQNRGQGTKKPKALYQGVPGADREQKQRRYIKVHLVADRGQESRRYYLYQGAPGADREQNHGQGTKNNNPPRRYIKVHLERTRNKITDRGQKTRGVISRCTLTWNKITDRGQKNLTTKALYQGARGADREQNNNNNNNEEL